MLWQWRKFHDHKLISCSSHLLSHSQFCTNMNKCHCHPEFMGLSCNEEVPTTTTIATPGSTMTYERHETPYGMLNNKIIIKKIVEEG